MKSKAFFSIIAAFMLSAGAIFALATPATGNNVAAVAESDALPLLTDCCLRLDSDGNYSCEEIAVAVACAIDVNHDVAYAACLAGQIQVIPIRSGFLINYLPSGVSFQVPPCPPC